MQSEEIEVPRCHYCQRFAPEIQYDIISVCVKCIDKMTAQRPQCVYAAPNGQLISTASENVPEDAILFSGTFTECWDWMSERDPFIDQPRATDSNAWIED